MQIEVIYELRQDKDLAIITADYMATVINDTSVASGYTGNDAFKLY